MNYSGINFCDAANGPGMRVALFVSGCSLHCKGCFNKAAWDREYGLKYDNAVEYSIIQALSEDFIEGLSILGGDPLEPYNEEELTKLCKLVKKLLPNKTIWLWTGRKYEDVKDHPIMEYVDVIVDGPFIERKKVSEQGSWFGSSNQRVIRIHDVHEADV